MIVYTKGLILIPLLVFIINADITNVPNKAPVPGQHLHQTKRQGADLHLRPPSEDWTNGVYHTEKSAIRPRVKVIYQGGLQFEGPHWSVDENALYWVDIRGQNVLRLDPDTGNVTTRHIEYGPVSFVVTVKDSPKLLLVSVRTELYFVSWDSALDESSLRLLTAVDLGMPGNRCNDGKVDAQGRLWFGTMGTEKNRTVESDEATLYMLTEDNFMNPLIKVRPVSVSNGIAWSSDNKLMFYNDSPTRNVDVFDFDLEKGIIRNRRTLFSYEANNVTGRPDGMTIDNEDNLWVACSGGRKVIKIDSTAGTLLEQYDIPVQSVSSVMWGGQDLATLFVTTSSYGLTAEELAEQPLAGSLFSIEGTGSKGVPQNQFVFTNASQY